MNSGTIGQIEKPRHADIVDWSSVSSSEFWCVADVIQSRVLRESERLFSYLDSSPPALLREILIQYRYFTVYYIPDLALLITRLDPGPMRSFLADILYDELGRGKSETAHPKLYDDFLATIGVDTSSLDGKALSTNISLLDVARRHLVDPKRSNQYAVGLRGMGGECVCQVYIQQLYKHLLKNPYVQEHTGKIDWRFWDLHVGEHDIEHREHTRALIDTEFVSKGGAHLKDLGDGYAFSMEQWQAFWSNIFAIRPEASDGVDFGRTAVRSSVNVQISHDGN
jgi:hypothetical protein